MRLASARTAAVAASALCLLVAGCDAAKPAASGSSAPATAGQGSHGAASTTGGTTVTKGTQDRFSVCSTADVRKDAAGRLYCSTTAHEIPLGAASITCIADLGATPPASAALDVTYSVFFDGRNVAFQHWVPKERTTVKGFQVSATFSPKDVNWTTQTKLPPGSYYCEWYTTSGAKLGQADLVHGSLPSSTVGTKGTWH